MMNLMIDLTPEETATITRLRAELHAAGYPAIYPVDRASFQIIEDYYQRAQREEVAAWRAAGEPDDWPNPLWLTWTKTGQGLQFKGCELVVAGETFTCAVCGLPIAVGDWPCVKTIRPHGKSVQTDVFSTYFDIGLGEEVTSLGDRWKGMKEQRDPRTGDVVRERLEYRDKMSKGDQSARLDRVAEQRREQAR